MSYNHPRLGRDKGKTTFFILPIKQHRYHSDKFPINRIKVYYENKKTFSGRIVMETRKISQKLTLILFTLSSFWLGYNLRAEPRGDLFDMSIEELMNVEIESSSSLTQTTRKLQPSTVTTITREQIAASGARSLDELLDIYVPNLQILRTDSYFQSIGLRGISSITADKLLILINGKETNEHTNYGAISERDLPMLTDIHHIDVVRGPV